MSPKTFVVLSILTVVALGAAVLAPGLNQGYQPASGAGDRVFPKLIDRANDVAAVETGPASGAASVWWREEVGREDQLVALRGRRTDLIVVGRPAAAMASFATAP